MKFHLVKDFKTRFTKRKGNNPSFTRIASISPTFQRVHKNERDQNCEKDFGQKLEHFLCTTSIKIVIRIAAGDNDGEEPLNQLKVKVADKCRVGVLKHIENDVLSSNIRVKVQLKNFHGRSKGEFINVSTLEMPILEVNDNSKKSTEGVVPVPSTFLSTWKSRSRFTCDLTISVYLDIEFAPKKHSTPVKSPKPKLDFDMLCINKKMLFQEISPDVDLIMGDGSHRRSHKHILAAHSPVFEKKFRRSSELSVSSFVSVPDLASVSADAFLYYIYFWDTTVAEEKGEVAFDLLRAARSYDISSLAWKMKRIILEKSECERFFSVELALSLFLYAQDVLKDDLVLEAALKVLKAKGLEELRASEAFQEVFKKNCEAAMELFILLRQTKCKTSGGTRQ